MGISAHDRARYARHLLLPQLGEEGQARLLATTLAASPDADPGALAVAERYLTRAGVRVVPAVSTDGSGGSSPSLPVPSRDELDRIAGRPALTEAARALAGALAAVHAIKAAARIEARPESPIPAISSEEA